MATASEYAVLSDAVYTRSIPVGWALLGELGTPGAGGFRVDPDSGFLGGAYRNVATDEIVVAFAGTDFLSRDVGTDVESKGGHSPPDKVASRVGGMVGNAHPTALVARDRTKFARFDLELDDQRGSQNLKVNVYEKDFVAKFREYRFDPSAWAALVDHFNRTCPGRASVGRVGYRMRYDSGEEGWVFSVVMERR
ncbi:MAG: hypothetical protein ACYDA8_09240 [Deferrisomatales bacterium]